MQQFSFGLAGMSFLLQMKIDSYSKTSILQVILLNYLCSNPEEYLSRLSLTKAVANTSA